LLSITKPEFSNALKIKTKKTCSNIKVTNTIRGYKHHTWLLTPYVVTTDLRSCKHHTWLQTYILKRRVILLFEYSVFRISKDCYWHLGRFICLFHLYIGGGVAQLVERRASNRKVAKPWLDSRCGNPSIAVSWERRCVLGKTLTAISHPESKQYTRCGGPAW